MNHSGFILIWEFIEILLNISLWELIPFFKDIILSLSDADKDFLFEQQDKNLENLIFY